MRPTLNHIAQILGAQLGMLMIMLAAGCAGLEHFAGAAHADKVLTWSGIHQRKSSQLPTVVAGTRDCVSNMKRAVHVFCADPTCQISTSQDFRIMRHNPIKDQDVQGQGWQRGRGWQSRVDEKARPIRKANPRSNRIRKRKGCELQGFGV